MISEDFEVSIGGDSSFAQSSSEEEEEEEYIPVVTAPRKSRASGASMKSIRKAQTPKKIVEVEEEEEEEMVLPKKMSKKVAADVKEIEGDKENHKAVEEEHDEDEDGDFGMKKSIVKNNSNKIKKKRFVSHRILHAVQRTGDNDCEDITGNWEDRIFETWKILTRSPILSLQPLYLHCIPANLLAALHPFGA